MDNDKTIKAARDAKLYRRALAAFVVLLIIATQTAILIVVLNADTKEQQALNTLTQVQNAHHQGTVDLINSVNGLIKSHDTYLVCVANKLASGQPSDGCIDSLVK